ncbi:unnamed protein product [Heligmosomoides polygyrus]|uniref:Uncharacterized protein n=1 Tax=Heligmosomoides polygyrus TaxID=6339 RepID=A0A183GIF1_HELPZ|nr:unnamed protein product [Heligmosomoides polygyrus]
MSSREINPGSSSLTIFGRPSGFLKENHNLKADIHQRRVMRFTSRLPPKVGVIADEAGDIALTADQRGESADLAEDLSLCG